MELEVNGSPEVHDDEIPKRFVDGCLGDPKEARRRWQLTKTWRKEFKTNAILDAPQRHYADCKKIYPHYLHKTTRSGMYVYVECPGKCDLKRFLTIGVSLDDMVRHYVFLTEMTWRVIDPRDDAALVTIFDLEGGSMNDLAGNALKLFTKCTEVIQLHYPERSSKLFIINAPWWFQTAFAIVSQFIDPRTKKKMVVLGKDYRKKLLKEIHPENLPVEYGGTDTCPIGMSPTERQIWDHVTEVNARYGIKTETIEAAYAEQKKLPKRRTLRVSEAPATKMPKSKSTQQLNTSISRDDSATAFNVTTSGEEDSAASANEAASAPCLSPDDVQSTVLY